MNLKTAVDRLDISKTPRHSIGCDFDHRHPKGENATSHSVRFSGRQAALQLLEISRYFYVAAPCLPARKPRAMARSIAVSRLNDFTKTTIAIALLLIAGHSSAEMKVADLDVLMLVAQLGDTKSLKEIEDSAESGDARAQFRLALIYSEGKGTPRNISLSKTWLIKSAIAGYGRAEYRLGSEYETTGDYAQAMLMYKKSSDHGDAAAMIAIGKLYYQGKGIKNNKNLALTWYENAKQHGHALVWFSLSNMYERGQVIPKNPEQELICLTKAADLGFSFASSQLAMKYENGIGVKKDAVQTIKWTIISIPTHLNIRESDEDNLIKLENKAATKEQIIEGKNLANEWLKTHYQRGIYELEENP